MNGTTSGSSLSVGRLIAVPAVFTLAVTILRLVGELQHWGAPWFNSAAGGGFAVVGISWLPIIFGPYFASKVAAAGAGPSGMGKAFGMAGLAIVVLVLGSVILFFGFSKQMAFVVLLGGVIQLASAFVARIGWRAFGNVLLAYAFAARIPVVVVMYIAMSAKGGQGWGTHYDIAGPGFTVTSLAQKFFELSLVPQMGLWIGYTVIVGTLFGCAFLAIFGRRSTAATA
ncbi:MAG TPA: hypothetical protein VL523_07640 [Terriglobia bacterium]|nr:hypothetical protein [Terriglobia bacterium]